MTNLTENEKALLIAIVESEYQSTGGQIENTIGVGVWTSCVWGFCGKAQFGGIMASLVKKGLAHSDDCGRDSTVWIKAAGVEALKATGYDYTASLKAAGYITA